MTVTDPAQSTSAIWLETFMNSLEYGQGGFGGVAVGLKRLAEFEVCASVTVAKERARRIAAKNRFICYSIKKTHEG